MTTHHRAEHSHSKHERRSSLRISHIERIVHSKLDEVHKATQSPHPAHGHHPAGGSHSGKHHDSDHER